MATTTQEVFPEIARAVKAIPLDNFIIDGEVVVLDKEGKPSFSLLQQRGSLHNAHDIKRAAVEIACTFFTFDLLAAEGYDARSLPLTKRKELLASVAPKVGAVRYLDHIETLGEAFHKQVGTMGLEGVIAKKADTPYKAGRSPHWLKIKADRTGDFAVVGFTEPKGGRVGFGALQLADLVGGKFVYAGRAGTGFTEKMLKEWYERLLPDAREEPPCFGPVKSPDEEPPPSSTIPEVKTTTWVEPKYVVEVRFTEWTHEGVLRHPAFLRVRDDKRVDQVERQWLVKKDESPKAKDQSDEPEARGQKPENGEAIPDSRLPIPQVEAPKREIALSNLNKVFWKDEKYTKGDLIEYYRSISPWLLPYLRNRPLVLTRFPDGIDGKSFYQKDAPEFAPDWIRTVPIWSNDTQRDINYFVCDDVDSLVYIANLGTIPLHIWMSQVGSLEQVDWCVIDLDPKDATFADVIKCAQVLHRICEEIGLPNYVKTTGKTGLHILIPLGKAVHVRTVALHRRAAGAAGDQGAWVDRHDHAHDQQAWREGLHRLPAEPPRPADRGAVQRAPPAGATVSMPLTWDEVNDELDPKNYTIKNAVARMEALGEDPVLPVLEEKPKLTKGSEEAGRDDGSVNRESGIQTNDAKPARRPRCCGARCAVQSTWHRHSARQSHQHQHRIQPARRAWSRVVRCARQMG
jgi:bifunctional non-homologous end joining protein LigD